MNFLKNQSVIFCIFVLFGFLISYLNIYFFNVNLTEIDYSYFSYSLLAIGLYGGVYGINIGDFLENKKVIFSAVTIGVVLKSIIIGGLLFFATGSILSFLLGVVVAQIDPVSVGHLLKGGKSKRLSQKGETVLRAWSSFDDPMTVLLALYIVLPVILGFTLSSNIGFNFSEYFLQLLGNICFSGAVFSIYKVGKNVKKHEYFKIFLLIFSFVVSIYFGYILAIAIIALFLRPNIDKILDIGISLAFYSASILLGILLISGIYLVMGLFLAIFCVLSQVIVSFLIARNFSFQDRAYLGLGQQNGITSIILAVLLFQYFSSTLGIIVPAIIFINILHLVLNILADKYFLKHS